MFSWRPPVVAAAIVLGLLACGYAGLVALTKSKVERPIKHTVNDPSDANTTWRSVKPLSHAEAVKAGRCPIPLPPEATNIQYVDFYPGYHGSTQYVRFEAPVETCRGHAAGLLKSYNQRMEAMHNDFRVEVHAKPFGRSTAEAVARLIREEEEETARVDWFDADAIVRGEMWGDHRSHAPLVLIDTDRGVFYYCISD